MKGNKKMRQYSTPKIKFHLKGDDLDTVLSGTCYLTFGTLDTSTDTFTEKFDATYETETENGQTYLVATLTQAQSAMFDANSNAYVQFRSKTGDSSVVSSIAPVRVLPTIKAKEL